MTDDRRTFSNFVHEMVTCLFYFQIQIHTSFSNAHDKSSDVVIFQSTMVAQMFLQMPQMSICLVCYKVKIMEVISINFVMMFLFLQTCSEEVYFCFCLLSENTHYFPQGTMLESTLNSGGVVCYLGVDISQNLRGLI